MNNADKFKSAFGLYATEVWAMSEKEFIEWLKKEDAAPTIDAVPVVRCKECKHYREGKVLSPQKFCFRLRGRDGEAIGYNFAEDDFCSYWERSEDGGEEH